MTIFALKLIAYFFMIVDHVKYAFPSLNNDFTLYFGRIAFPLFVFFAVEGYKHTKNYWKYVGRLIIFAIITQIPFSLFNSLPTLNQPENLNVLFTLTLGIVSIKVWDDAPNYFVKIISFIILASFAEYFKTDYGFWGVFLILLVYLCSDTKIHILLGYAFGILLKYAIRIIYWEEIKHLKLNYDYISRMCICSLVPAIIIMLYNGKSGTKKLNKLFYWIYPVHLLLFWLLSPYTFNLLGL